MTFLDVIATQVLALRQRHEGVRLPLLLMNSAITQGPSVDLLRRRGLELPGLPLDFLQGREPKIRADDHFPVEWPADPDLEWCPPGHGDIYPALEASGTLDTLLDAGLRYAFVSNSDNLGAIADVRIADWFAAEQVPFALEATRGTPADRKGGHLASYQGHIVLRETAQVPDGDDSFSDVERWRWYNTNNVWIDLRALKDLQASDQAAPRSAADRQPQDRGPARLVQHPGDPARVGHRRRDRLDSRSTGDPGAADPVRPGQDHRRPAGGALRRLRPHRRRGDEADLRGGRAGGVAGQGLLPPAAGLRQAVPVRAAVAAALPRVCGLKVT